MNTPIYDSRNIQYKNPFGAVRHGKDIRFTIKLDRSIGVLKAYFIIRKEGEDETIKIPMSWSGTERGIDQFSCTYTANEIGLYWYGFMTENLKNNQYLIKNANSLGELADNQNTCWQLTIYSSDFSTPDWLKGGILYQIFPDRFYKENSNPQNVPEDREMNENWGGTPDYDFFTPNKKVNNDYFGGNIKGIIAKLDYLVALGVSAIYLNPIFEAHSNHRYNTADYSKIDPLLGTLDDFNLLCEKAKKRNIRIILDGVFNHTGEDSIYFNRFNRYEELGAYQSRESRFSTWFNFINWPEEYRSWWGIKSLPEINKMNGEFIHYILGEEGILVNWMKEGASGWRLDVVDELPSVFVKKLRQTVKSANSDALIIGEVWEDASNKISYGQRREYLLGQELDSVMNYPFKEAIIGFMKDHNAVLLNDTIMTILENYPKPVIDVLMNILGTHDTARIVTRLCGESSDGKDYHWKANRCLTAEEKEKGFREVAIAATILYFLPGVPCVYYGDEIGLEGYEDPFNRRCFNWEETHGWLTKWFQKIGGIRRNYELLKEGFYQPVIIEEGFFSFVRKEDTTCIVCAINMNAYKFTFKEEPNKQTTTLASLDDTCPSEQFDIPPMSCRIYLVDENKCI